MSNTAQAIEAQATLHHAFFLGLQLMVSVEESPDVIGDWMFRLFRRQHEAKFLSSFNKLGLTDLPDAVACAQYHVLSNSIGGVPVEYAYESERKAWVRFRYPRWMFAGPTICGLPVQASHGFLRGWYAHNGVSLGNPRLGFVCISQDMTGEFGLCGYFKEYDHELDEEQRLIFMDDELPPAFNVHDQPVPPAQQWDEERLAKANRNYAIEYLRNGIPELVNTVGRQRGRDLTARAARLIGLQYFQQLIADTEHKDGDHQEAARFINTLITGFGDEASLDAQPAQSKVNHQVAKLTHGLAPDEAEDVLTGWPALVGGLLDSHQQLKHYEFDRTDQALTWTIRDR